MNTPNANVPISAFAPISFTFRILERDFLGVAGPLFAAALLGHLDWIVLGFGLVGDLGLALAIEGVWLVVGSYAEAGMLRFCLKVARGEPYGYRDLRAHASSVLALVLLRLILYAALAVSFLLFWMGLSGDRSPENELWIERLPSFGDSIGLPGVMLLCVLLLVLWAIGMTRAVIAPVLIVDERIGTLHALARSMKLTRGYGVPIFLYGVILLMIGGMVQTLAPGAVLAALATPGIVFLGLAVRGELVG